jgi:hypothetical protein
MSKPLFSFGVIADCQYADRDDATAISSDRRHTHDNRYRLSPDKLKEAIEFFNQQQLEFVVHLGDFVDNNIKEYAPPLLDIVSGSRAPFWHVLGNHEYHKANCDEAEILATYGLEKSYYAKSVKSHKFIVLDTNELGVIKHPDKNTLEWQEGNRYLQTFVGKGALNAYPWNGGLDTEQMRWLKKEIETAYQAGERVIVFAHHPIYPHDGANALNDDEILGAIDESSGIIAYINGHNHFGAVGVRGGVPYVTIPAMLEDQKNAYAICNVYDDALEFIGYGKAQDLRFEIA